MRNASAAEQVIVRTPGGVFDDIKRKTIYEPFRKETGIEVVPVAATAAKLMAMIKAGQNELDVIDTGDSTLLELESNDLDAARLQGVQVHQDGRHRSDRQAQVPGRQLHLRHGPRLQHQGLSRRASEPKSWAEFWDVKPSRGARTLPDMASGTPSLEFALIADGVPMDKLYPIDIDRAFKSHVAHHAGDPEVLGHRRAVVAA